jgi:dUTP pyrophosphatase
MELTKVELLNNSTNPTPKYQTEGAAGIDLASNEDVVIKSGTYVIVGTGLSIALPMGLEAQIRPRSGLAAKHGVTVLNSPGTIDCDYRGEIKVMLINHGADDFIIKKGDRIAQMVIAKYEQVEFIIVEELDETNRGTGGLGSTGIKN